ncbi:hypothetical protein GCM10023200_24840 [Actinomycetospora chlora]|uniref:Asp23/Gls24 family envelope stress response protein n=1 Tax=Actinomycetospora chlora TaxID=663608 RepID=A0ABP9B3R3_9PSEU
MTAATVPTTPAAERGELTIADGVVARLVDAAAGEVEGVTVPAAGGLPLGRRARARVRRGEGRLDVGLTLDVTYPTPVAATADAVRDHVVARVRELAGLEVDRVDVEVATLVAADTPRTGRVVA